MNRLDYLGSSQENKKLWELFLKWFLAEEKSLQKLCVQESKSDLAEGQASGVKGSAWLLRLTNSVAKPPLPAGKQNISFIITRLQCIHFKNTLLKIHF